MDKLLPHFSLQGQTAVVTGGSGHFGIEICKSLINAGARVYALGRTEIRADFVCSSKASHERFEYFRVDITDPIAVDQFVSAVIGESGINILINNAYAGKSGTIGSSSDQEFRDSYEIAMVAANRLIAALTPNLKLGYETHNNASVVNVASMYGIKSPKFDLYDSPKSTNPPFYGAAKAALIQYSRYAACEFARDGIRVNSISPGAFPNLTTQKNDPEFIERLRNNTPMNRIGQPEELANCVLFLASSASSFVTGTNLVVDGGWTAQ